MAKITIPYAVSDFVEMRERGFYYVDKTRYISGLEDYKSLLYSYVLAVLGRTFADFYASLLLRSY